MSKERDNNVVGTRFMSWKGGNYVVGTRQLCRGYEILCQWNEIIVVGTRVYVVGNNYVVATTYQVTIQDTH